MQTEKGDWLNDLLASESWLVSSHQSFVDRAGLTEADISLRFVGNRSIGYKFILVILQDDARALVDSLSSNTELEALFKLLRKVSSQSLYCLVFGKNCAYAGEDIKGLDLYTHDSLTSFFKKIIPPSVENVGNVKEENQSINDSFQSWTRSKLSKYIAVNDFDAICVKEENGSLHILELKRIKANPQEWCPYLDDAANYLACKQLVQNKFRTIAYNEGSDEAVAVFKLDDVSKENISGTRYVLSQSSCGPITTEKLYMCRQNNQKFESKNKRHPKSVKSCKFGEIF